jgi:hypothetical protein
MEFGGAGAGRRGVKRLRCASPQESEEIAPDSITLDSIATDFSMPDLQMAPDSTPDSEMNCSLLHYGYLLPRNDDAKASVSN